MSFLDDIKAKAEELLNGGVEEATGNITEQVQDVISGANSESGNENEEQK